MNESVIAIREKVLEIRTARDKASFVNYFKKHPAELDKLIQLVLQSAPYPYKEYASWILIHLYKSNQFDFTYLYPKLVDLCFATKDQTVLRNVVCCLSTSPIGDYRESEFIDLLIAFIQDDKNKVALHVYSIYVLIQFVQKYPELKSEIQEIIERNSLNKTAAYVVAHRNFIKTTQSID